MSNKHKLTGGTIEFISLCKRGNLLGAQEYLRLNPQTNISLRNHEAFRLACAFGHLNVARWLLQMYRERGQDIDISAEDEFAFRWACERGYLDVAQWLLDLKPDIDITADNNYAFLWVCKNGYLDIAQWLLQLYRERGLDITDICNQGFAYSCRNRHLEVAKWFETISGRYEIIDKDTPNWRCEIKKYDPKDVKFDKNKKLLWLSEQKGNLVEKLPTDIVRMTASYL
jgi:hypothetical protein